MKLLTFRGPGRRRLVVPGHFTLELGGSHEIDDHTAERLAEANPHLDLEITDLPARRRRGGDKPAPAPAAGTPDTPAGGDGPTTNEEE